MKIRPLVALDIGSTKVACAIGLPHDAAPGFELLGSSVVPYPVLPTSWLSDPVIVSRTVERALEATAVSGDMDRALVAINPPTLVSEQVRATISLGDEPITIRAQDLDRLQSAALQQVLGVDREPLLVERLACAGNGFDGVRDPRGLSATRLIGTFHVLTMPISARRAVVQAVESAGLDVAQVTSTLPAVLASVAETQPLLDQQRVLLIDVGGLSTTIGLFVEGALHALRVVPEGGLTLAEQIATALSVTMDQALTWSLEGMGCRKAEVPTLIEARRESIKEGIEELLREQPRPDAILVSGRGALGDGFAEWLERTLGMTSALCRSPRTNTLSDLGRQVGTSAAIGLLETAVRGTHPHHGALSSPHRLNRLLHRTKAILTEYF